MIRPLASDIEYEEAVANHEISAQNIMEKPSSLRGILSDLDSSTNLKEQKGFTREMIIKKYNSLKSVGGKPLISDFKFNEALENQKISTSNVIEKLPSLLGTLTDPGSYMDVKDHAAIIREMTIERANSLKSVRKR